MISLIVLSAIYKQQNELPATIQQNELPATIPQNAQCAKKVFMRTSREPKREETFATKDHFEKCEFVPLEEGGPQPVVFVVNGRSGSDSTWGTLANLAGGFTPIGEHTGQNVNAAIDFMGNMTTQQEGFVRLFTG